MHVLASPTSYISSPDKIQQIFLLSPGLDDVLLADKDKLDRGTAPPRSTSNVCATASNSSPHSRQSLTERCETMHMHIPCIRFKHCAEPTGFWWGVEVCLCRAFDVQEKCFGQTLKGVTEVGPSCMHSGRQCINACQSETQLAADGINIGRYRIELPLAELRNRRSGRGTALQKDSQRRQLWTRPHRVSRFPSMTLVPAAFCSIVRQLIVARLLGSGAYPTHSFRTFQT